MTIQSISSQSVPATVIQATGSTPGASTTPGVSSAAAPVAASEDVPAAKSESVDAKELTDAVAQVQGFTQSLAKELTFSIDKDSGRTVVNVIDSSTNEVIRQIPSKEMLGIASALDKIQGLLIKQKA